MWSQKRGDLSLWVPLHSLEKACPQLSQLPEPLWTDPGLKSGNVAHALSPPLSSHLSLNREGHLGTTDDFTPSFLHFSLFSTEFWDLVNSRPVHSLMLSSNLFLCLPCLLPPFTVPCKMVSARPDEWEI